MWCCRALSLVITKIKCFSSRSDRSLLGCFVTYLLLLILSSVRDVLRVALHSEGSNYKFRSKVPLPLPSLPLKGKLPVASRFARYASRVLVKRFSQFSNCTSVLCYHSETERIDVFLVFVYANIFERMSLSLWVLQFRTDFSYIAIDREYRLHSRRVLPNFFGFVVNKTWKSTGRVL